MEKQGVTKGVTKVITTEKVLAALDSADGDALSKNHPIVREIRDALDGFEESLIYRELCDQESERKGIGIRVAFSMGIETGYKIAQAEKMEESLNG
jgi:hypothetical protein